MEHAHDPDHVAGLGHPPACDCAVGGVVNAAEQKPAARGEREPSGRLSSNCLVHPVKWADTPGRGLGLGCRQRRKAAADYRVCTPLVCVAGRGWFLFCGRRAVVS